MTTIAYKDGVLAADSRLTDGGLITPTTFVKVIATDKHLAGAAGDADYLSMFLSWVKGGCQLDKIPRYPIGADKPSFNGIIIDRAGNVAHYEGTMTPIKIGKPQLYAIGSGAELAIGAMAYGASASEAVKIASKYDAYTGGRIRTVGFKK